MTLKDPEKVTVSHTGVATSHQISTTNTKTSQNKISTTNTKTSQNNQQKQSTDNEDSDVNDSVKEEEEETFALPSSLKQYFVITPCKLRLVVLLTLIMSKCQVSFCPQ